MTSIVKTHAHCASNKEVVVVVTKAGGDILDQFVLQDGEVKEVLIYDDRTVSSFERLKEVVGSPVASEMPVVE